MANSPTAPRPELPETIGYRMKRKLLGKPLVTEELEGERLSNPIAMGVLTCDCISSSAYGTEEILTILVPIAGVAAFTLVIPVTIVILIVLVLVTLSYREVVQVYTKAGGSYVVARDNFGPNVAQIAAVALLIDYTVTVAVQTAAGTDALTSAVPALDSYRVPICLAVVCLLIYGNLRGIREAGSYFAFPTYFFITMMVLVIGFGLAREIFGDLPVLSLVHKGTVHIGHKGPGLLEGVGVFYLLRAFANGGSSLTGLEAISNSVSAFRRPEGANARKVLIAMSATLGTLVLGVSLLAHFTHAVPYADGSPTVISQVAKAAFGASFVGHAGYYLVQAATLLILYTGGNTSFNGFPFLASFVAEDRFLPQALTRRGHRLSFSNGIIVLGVVALMLLLVTKANVDSLVGVYAIGVFTGFTMAGSGMVKHHLNHRHGHWRRKLAINGSAAVVSFAIVIIFAVTKFKQGAWVVVVLFPIMMTLLVRLNRQYRREAAILGEGAAERAVEAPALRHHVAFVLVDSLDLATARAVQYARTLSVDDVRAVHFVIDAARARRLSERWVRLGMRNLPLELRECQDRRLMRACLELAYDETADGDTEVSVLLPRRAYGRVWKRFLHDQTAERIGATLSRLPHVNATIVPFDVTAAIRDAEHSDETVAPADAIGADTVATEDKEDEKAFALAGAVTSISAVHDRQRVRVAGRVRSVTVQPWGSVPTLECALSDDTGKVVVAFLGRRQIAGIEPGSRLVIEGTVTNRKGHLTVINPTYELLANPEL
jgi:amino acid transporter